VPSISRVDLEKIIEEKLQAIWQSGGAGREALAENLREQLKQVSLHPDFLYSIGTGTAGDTPYQLNMPHGCFVTQNEIYVADYKNGKVKVFNKLGGYIEEFATDTKPTDVYVTRDYVFVCDFERHRICQYDRATKAFIRQFGETDVPGDGKNHLNYPRGIWGDWRHIYVADRHNARVVVLYLPNLTYLNEFTYPTFAARDKYNLHNVFFENERRRIYVSTIDTVEVFKASSDRAEEATYNHVATIGTPGVTIDPEDKVLHEARAIYIADGYLFIGEHNSVAIFDLNDYAFLGRIIRTYPIPYSSYYAPDRIASLHNVTGLFVEDGKLYVTSALTHQIHVFKLFGGIAPKKMPVTVLPETTVGPGETVNSQTFNLSMVHGSAPFALTVEVAFASGATGDVHLHLQSSTNFVDWDTVDVATFTIPVSPGATVRQTFYPLAVAKVYRVQVENLDATESATVKVDVVVSES